MAKYQQELARINGAEMRLTELERNLKLNEENYQLYVKKMEEARVSNAMDKEQMVNISVAEPALPPVKPAKPKILLNIALSIVLGAVSGLGVAFFSEYLAHTFNNPEDVEAASWPSRFKFHKSVKVVNKGKINGKDLQRTRASTRRKPGARRKTTFPPG